MSQPQSMSDASLSQDSQLIPWMGEPTPLTDPSLPSNLPTLACLVSRDDTLPNQVVSCINQPVLLWGIIRNKAVEACHVVKDGNSEKMHIQSKERLSIPSNYNGLFEIVDTAKQATGCYTNIEQISRILPKYFFTKTPIKSIEVMSENIEDNVYPERVVLAGSTLKVLRLFSTRWKSTVETGLIKRRSVDKITDEVTYLECETHTNRRILISLKYAGKFYAIYDKSRKDEKLVCVYRMKDLISDVMFPVTCKLVLGKEPTVTYSFTGLLRLVNATDRSVLVASTLKKTDNSLFEIDTTLSVEIRAMEDSESVDPSARSDAVGLCSKYAVSFASLMKPHYDTNSKLPKIDQTKENVDVDNNYSRVDKNIEALKCVRLSTSHETHQNITLSGESDV